MAYQNLHSSRQRLWELTRAQHGVVSRGQLLDLGFSPEAIKHRIRKGRLHPVYRGVYVLGRPSLARHGRWTAAVLSCGPEAVLSHASAAALWEFANERWGQVEVSVPIGIVRRRPGILVHRRPALTSAEVTRRHGIPVTTPIRTLMDLAQRMPQGQLERAINDADKQGLTDPEALRSAIATAGRLPGIASLREMLDRRTFARTDSELERRFLRIVVEAGLPLPETGRYVNGFKVDFWWSDFGLIVETDGLRYHRTPAQQATDRLRDQAHAVAGLTCLRFTHAQVHFEPGHVRTTLLEVANRLSAIRRGD